MILRHLKTMDWSQEREVGQEFEVKLTDPQDCHIRGGATCRVKIIDQVGSKPRTYVVHIL